MYFIARGFKFWLYKELGGVNSYKRVKKKSFKVVDSSIYNN